MPLVVSCCCLVLRVGAAMPEGFSQVFLLPFRFLVCKPASRRCVWGESPHVLASSPEYTTVASCLLLGLSWQQRNFFCLLILPQFQACSMCLGLRNSMFLEFLPLLSLAAKHHLVWLFLGDSFLPLFQQWQISAWYRYRILDPKQFLVLSPGIEGFCFCPYLSSSGSLPCSWVFPSYSSSTCRFCFYFSPRSSISLLIVLEVGGKNYLPLSNSLRLLLYRGKGSREAKDLGHCACLPEALDFFPYFSATDGAFLQCSVLCSVFFFFFLRKTLFPRLC